MVPVMLAVEPSKLRELNKRAHDEGAGIEDLDGQAVWLASDSFSDREPVGPYAIEVPARRTRHLRFNELEEPEEVPRDVDFSSVLESDVPVVVQHPRLDSRQSELGLLSTLAYSE